MKDQVSELRLQVFTKFSKSKLAEMRRFVGRCKRLDGFDPLFYWESIKNRRNLGINEILCYADKELIAYLALYHFEANEIEITLITHPKYRTPEVFSLLWDRAKRAVSQYSVDITRYVFTCNQQLIPLKEYLSRLGAQCLEYTYKAALSHKNYFKIKAVKPVPDLEFRLASELDIPALAELEMNCFQISKETYKSHLVKTFEDMDKRIFIAIRNGKIVGKIHAQLEKKNALLYDFCIEPKEQRKGFRTALLMEAGRFLFERDIRKVIVDIVDEYDLKWYSKFNFKCIETYEHWKLAPCANPLKEREKQLEALLLNFHCHQVQDQLSLTVYKH